MKRILPGVCLSAFVVATVILSGCTSSSHTPPPLAISVSITNKITTIAAASAAVTLNATVQNDSSNSGVTWALTPAGCSPNCGAISNQTATSMTYTPPSTQPNGASATPTITATSVADHTKSDTDSFTITGPAAISVTITNKIASIVAGASAITFNATVQNDPLGGGVTWAIVVSGSDCEPTCGTLSGATATSVTYTPPATVPASPDNAPTLIATSVDDSTKTDSDAFTITAANNDAVVSGQYAFLIQGFDDATGDQFAYIGSLTADGSGNITTGVEDVNLPSGVKTAVPISGTYTVGTDNRGTVTITTATGSNTFAFAAGALNGSGIATKLRVIEFDDNNGTSGRRGSGVAYLQDSTAFALSSLTGPYALQINGQNGSAGSKAAIEGSFSTAGSGTISGTADLNSVGTLLTGQTLSGTLATTSATSSSGRLTLPFTVGPNGFTSVVYIVSAGHLLLMQSDPINAGLLSGEVLQQTSTAFTTASLSGANVLYSAALSSVAGKSYVQAGVLNFNSTTATGTISLDTNDGGTPGTVSTTFTYTVKSNGQVTVTPATGSVLDFYLIDTNKAFIMDEGSTVNAGMLQPQSGGPFSVGSVNGNYFFGEAETAPVTAATVMSGIAISTGNGTVNATSDLSGPGSPFLASGQTQALTLTLTDATLGRFTDSNGDIVYIISPTSFVFFNGTSNNPSVILGEQ